MEAPNPPPPRTALGFGRPLPSHSFISSRPSPPPARPAVYTTAHKKRKISHPEAPSDDSGDERERGRTVERTTADVRAKQAETGGMRDDSAAARGLQLLLETISPPEIQHRLRSSLESNSLTPSQAEELVLAYNQSRDSAALLEVLDDADRCRAEAEAQAPALRLGGLGDRSSLTPTEESSVASLSRFPWPPAPLGPQQTPNITSAPSTKRQSPQRSRSRPRTSRSRERLRPHHRAASSTTLGPYRAVNIRSSSESPLFQRIVHAQKLFEPTPEPGRKSYLTSAPFGDPTRPGEMATDPVGGRQNTPGAENMSVSSGKSIRSNTPSRVTFDDLPTAHSSITARSRSRGPRPEISNAIAAVEAEQQKDRKKPGKLRKAAPKPIDLDARPTDPTAIKKIAPFYEPPADHLSLPTSPTSPSARRDSKGISTTWIGRLSNVFSQRKLDVDEPTSPLRGRMRASATMPLNGHVRSTPLSPIAQSIPVTPISQSTPMVLKSAAVAAYPPEKSKEPPRMLEKIITARHQHQTSSVYQNSIGGTPIGSIRASNLLDPEQFATYLVKSHIEYADDIHRSIDQPTDDGNSPPSDEKVEPTGNFENIDLMSEGDSDDESPPRVSPPTKKLERRRSGFSLFDFGLGRKSDAGSSRVSSHRPSDAGSRAGAASIPTSSASAATGVKHHRHTSSYGDQSQYSYGETQHTRSSSGRVPSLVPPDSVAPSLPSPASWKTGFFAREEKDDDREARPGDVGWVPFSFGQDKTRHEPKERQNSNNEIATFRVARASATSPSLEVPGRNESGSTANGTNTGSNQSNQNGSIVVFNENGIHHEEDEEEEARRMSSSNKDQGPGSLPSSSSHGILSHRASTASDDSGHGGSDGASLHDTHARARALAATGLGSLTHTKNFYGVNTPPQSKPSRVVSEHAVVDDGEAEDEEGDWETIAGSGLPSRGNTNVTLARKDASGSEEGPSSSSEDSPASKDKDSSPRRYDPSYLIHPADERYEHVYRIRESVPDGPPILLPAYNFSGGTGFPNRNALTRPSLIHDPSTNPYQHPLPLSKEHRHPFQSSPPDVHSSGSRRAIPRKPVNSPPSKPHAHKTSVYATHRSAASRRDEEVYANNAKHTHRNVSSSDSIEYNDPHGSFPSLLVTDIHREGSYEDAGIEADVADPNGSFAKITVLGPHHNITGTPEGTGMRLVGSSLADGSSPGMPWSSSSPAAAAGRHRHSPPDTMERIESLAQRYTPTSSPPRAHLAAPKPQDLQFQSQPGVLYEQIRAHRELLAAEGLLPRAFHPSAPRVGSSPVPRNSLFRGLNAHPMTHQDSRGRLYAAPFAFNVTEPLPPPVDPEKAVGFEYRLQRLPRDTSDASSARLRRKITLSRVILAVCVLFPPLLLLYGYGMLDAIMATITDGKVTRLSYQEKRIALFVGWGLAGAAIIGIVIGMIIIGLGR